MRHFTEHPGYTAAALLIVLLIGAGALAPGAAVPFVGAVMLGAVCFGVHIATTNAGAEVWLITLGFGVSLCASYAVGAWFSVAAYGLMTGGVIALIVSTLTGLLGVSLAQQTD